MLTLRERLDELINAHHKFALMLGEKGRYQEALSHDYNEFAYSQLKQELKDTMLIDREIE